MQIPLNSWEPFITCFGILLLLTLIMSAQSRHFYTIDNILRKFSIMELEIPSSPKAMADLIKGIFLLAPAQKNKSINALRGQLFVDFAFMPVAYGAIFFLCTKLSFKMHTAGHVFFIVLAFLQFIPWVLDIVENVFLLTQLKANVKELQPVMYKRYIIMEIFKWGISVFAAVCGLSMVVYFWLDAQFSTASVKALTYAVIELIVFTGGLILLNRRDKNLDSNR